MMDGLQVWQSFHFLRPEMFWALLPIVWLAYHGRKQSGGLAAWQKVVSPELLDYLKVGKSSQASNALLWASVLAAVLMVIAMAGPAWKKLPQPMYAEQSALIIALDLSKSMDAADVKPNRLTRAKQKLTDLLHLRDEGQAGLVVFAGSAFVVTPLTDDNQTILSQLQGLSTDIMPVQGGDLDAGLAKALALLTQSAVKHGRILLLTDSERYSEAMVKQVVQAGHRIDVIGVGTDEGAPIPKPNGGFVTDASGNIVIVKLHEDVLRQLALLGQGVYRRLSVDDSDIAMFADISSQALWQNEVKDKSSALSTTHDTWQEEGYWLLLPAMLLLLPMFRKGMLVIALILWMQPASSEAIEWQSLWQTSDKQGEALMQEKDYQKAEQVFENPRWKAAAAYKNQDYQAALDTLQLVESPDAEDWYNQGNALAKLGNIDAAIAAYDQALKQNPNHGDALANKALLQKIKEEQQQDKQNQDDKQKDGNQDKGNQDKQGDSSDAKQPQQGDKGQAQQKQGQEGQEKQDQGQSQNHGQQDDAAEQQAGQQGADNKAQDKEKQAEQAQQYSNKDAGQDKNKDDAEQNQQARAAQDKQEKKDEADQAQSMQQPSDDLEQTEAQQVFEQQLRRVPDDPSGLLRRKFLYQYQRQAGQAPERGEQW